MKSIIFSVIIAGGVALQATAKADVLKPKNTIETLTAQVQVAGEEFKYSVSDEGWFVFGSSGVLEGVKRFRLEYASNQQVNGNLDEMWSSLKNDVVTKCQELGEIEFADQRSQMDPKTQMSLKTEITTEAKFEFDGDMNYFARCSVQVIAQ